MSQCCLVYFQTHIFSDGVVGIIPLFYHETIFAGTICLDTIVYIPAVIVRNASVALDRLFYLLERGLARMLVDGAAIESIVELVEARHRAELPPSFDEKITFTHSPR